MTNCWSIKTPEINDLFVVVKQDQNHFEVGLHVKKTWEGVLSLLHKGSGMTSGHSLKVYRLNMRNAEEVLSRDKKGNFSLNKFKCNCCGQLVTMEGIL